MAFFASKGDGASPATAVVVGVATVPSGALDDVVIPSCDGPLPALAIAGVVRGGAGEADELSGRLEGVPEFVRAMLCVMEGRGIEIGTPLGLLVPGVGAYG